MINKLGDDLDSAITFVGGDTSQVSNIMQYPDIIREQLSAQGVTPGKEIILEGDSCIIIADSEGRDEYNTEYAIGVKTGLNPGACYIRICTAVKDIEPVYIDLTPVMSNIESCDVDIDSIVKEVLSQIDLSDILKTEEFNDSVKSIVSKEINSFSNDINERLLSMETSINSKVSEEQMNNAINIAIQNMSGSDNGIDVEELNW